MWRDVSLGIKIFDYKDDPQWEIRSNKNEERRPETQLHHRPLPKFPEIRRAAVAGRLSPSPVRSSGKNPTTIFSGYILNGIATRLALQRAAADDLLTAAGATGGGSQTPLLLFIPPCWTLLRVAAVYSNLQQQLLLLPVGRSGTGTMSFPMRLRSPLCSIASCIMQKQSSSRVTVPGCARATQKSLQGERRGDERSREKPLRSNHS